jgi:zinc protease
VLDDADDEYQWSTDTAVFQIGGPRSPALAALVEVDSATKMVAARDEVFARSTKLFDGVTARGLGRLIGQLELAIVARWDDLDARGSWIADFMQYTDHNWFMLAEMRGLAATDWRLASAQLAELFGEQFSHVAFIQPSGKGTTHTLASAVPTGSHSQIPWRAPVDAGEADRPLTFGAPAKAPVKRFVLANGLTVELAPDPRSPIVDARLVFPVGSAHEPSDRYGLATAAAMMLDNDTEGFYSQSTLDKLEWSLARGTHFDWYVSETATTFVTTGMAHYGDWHVWFLSWLLDQGRYNGSQLDAMRKRARELAKDEKTEIDRPALEFGQRLYGRGHPYAVPAPGVGAAFLALRGDDLTRWKRDHYRARGATLVISGDFELDAMEREVNELFGPWSDAEPAALPPVPAAQPMEGPSWLAAHDADLVQAKVRIGFATSSDPVEDAAARLVLSEMIQDGIRVVREGMGASYGVYVYYEWGASGGALLIGGDVDEAKAPEALTRVLAEVAAVRDGGAGQREAFVRARRKMLARALARRGGAASGASQLASLAANRLPHDYDRELAQRIAALTPDAVAKVAAADLAEKHMVVMVRGKAAVVDAALAAAGAATPTKIK